MQEFIIKILEVIIAAVIFGTIIVGVSQKLEAAPAQTIYEEIKNEY